MQQESLLGLMRPSAAADRFVDVALPLPLMQPMTYRVPAGWADVPRGSRVEAPFGKRRVMGVVVNAEAKAKEGFSVKNLTAVFDEEALEALRRNVGGYVGGIEALTRLGDGIRIEVGGEYLQYVACRQVQALLHFAEGDGQ